MAQLKDLIVTGASRFIGDVIANQLQITKLNAPATAGGTTYSLGSDGQVLLSNGSSVYWGSAAPTVTESTVSDWGFVKIGTSATTAAAGNHTHATSLAADSGTASVTLAHNTTYKLTAGGTNVIFKTPALPTNISSFTNDAGYITSADVPEGASAYAGTISAVGTTASTGTNNGFARGDHVHNITKATINSVLGTGSGTAKFYREDGTWATPAYIANTDEKLKIAAVTSGTTYYPIVAANSTAAANRQYDATGFAYTGTNGTTSAVGVAKITLGNSTASGTANNKQGSIVLYGSTAYATTITPGGPTAARTITLPNATGTVALAANPTIATDSGTATVSLAANTTYKLTAGGGSLIFKTPADGNTDTKVNVTARGTTKSYLLATTTSPTSTATGVTAVAETGVYLDTTAAKLVATTFKGNLEGTATSFGKGSHSTAVTANEFTPAVGTATLVGNVSNTTMPKTNNANAEMVIKAHPTSGENYYEARLGFSSNSNLYYMPVSGTSWKQLAYTSQLPFVLGTGNNSAILDGLSNTASGGGSVATGNLSVASGACSFAGGRKASSSSIGTTAEGIGSFAYGTSAYAKGDGSLAIGQVTTASGLLSSSFGNYTISSGRAQMVIGQYNIEDTEEDTTHGSGAKKNIFIIGNGTANDARSNALTVDWNGNTEISGYLKTNKIQIPTTSNGSSYGVGSSGQVLMSNGSTVYWGNAASSDTYVQKAGDTMTGNLIVSKSSGGAVKASNTSKGTTVSLDSDSSAGNHGIWSTGYWDGSAFQSDGKWIVYRGQNGNIYLNGRADTAQEAQGIYTTSISPNNSSETHADALKKWFDNNKANITRNQLLACYDTTGGNGSITFGYFLNGYDSNPYGGFFSAHYGTPYYIGISNGTYKQSQIWKKGDAVTGAVYNDYAEYRESHDTEFGYVVQELGDDTLQKTTKRLSHFAGVTSDTWGFAQGETEKAKTPIAVAGRVLVYPGEDRNKYQPGDCVCAGPGGKVYIMTREEIKEWPDRIVGTVSCVPDYDTWGIDYDEERPKVKVNGRIWIKVR